MQTDPTLSRTVVVSTKLDTRIPQFARGQDVELFLHPPGRLLEPGMLGGSPFYTCALASCVDCESKTCASRAATCTWLTSWASQSLTLSQVAI